MPKKRITIEFTDEEISYIEAFLNRTKLDPDEFDALTITNLAQLLLKDVALAMRRPGSWEGANMIQVLRSHGYDIF